MIRKAIPTTKRNSSDLDNEPESKTERNSKKKISENQIKIIQTYVSNNGERLLKPKFNIQIK
jgi:hypothetical protein